MTIAFKPSQLPGKRVTATARHYSVARVPAELVSSIFSEIQTWIWIGGLSPSFNVDVRHAVVTAADLVAALANGSEQLWAVFSDGGAYGAFRTSIYTNDHSRALAVFDLAGVCLEEWLGEMEETLIKYGRYQGCTALRLRGLAGLDELAPAYRVVGEHLAHSIYERAI